MAGLINALGGQVEPVVDLKDMEFQLDNSNTIVQQAGQGLLEIATFHI